MAKKKETMDPVEKEKLRKALQDFEGASNLDIINEDPEFYYFLAAKPDKYPGHPQSVDALSDLGYEVVNTENNSGEYMPHGTVREATGGAVQTNELVLMRIPRWLHEARMQRQVDDALSAAESSQEEFEEATRRVAAESGQDVVIFRNERSRERY